MYAAFISVIGIIKIYVRETIDFYLIVSFKFLIEITVLSTFGDMIEVDWTDSGFAILNNLKGALLLFRDASFLV
ncbi:hypothetical protein CN601_25425 [Bacillus sp. AFS017336]|nr:hypothetical protein CN601_25425 [Bacillus sp. AFS017336]